MAPAGRRRQFWPRGGQTTHGIHAYYAPQTGAQSSPIVDVAARGRFPVYWWNHCGSGGTGRRARLRILWPKGRGGSNPSFRTSIYVARKRWIARFDRHRQIPDIAREVLEPDCPRCSERPVPNPFCDSRVLITMAFFLVDFLVLAPSGHPSPAPSWTGVLRDKSGKPVADAVVNLSAKLDDRHFAAKTSTDGEFTFEAIAPGSYQLTVTLGSKTFAAATPVAIEAGKALTTTLELSLEEGTVHLSAAQAPTSVQASGGERLSGGEVSSLPLNERDFSKLLLLAAGTMTDTNGAANFTQQFAVNGQRGVTTVFAMDGFDTTDPEMGGATFSNFNVDAIQEVQSNSGVMTADIGHGAASNTNVVTKSGTNDIHGSLFEFLRNASLDARNYFDPSPAISGHRIPPFQRNEFGFTNGGPVVLPGLYDGRGRTYYFGEYQGFRQVLGTTQVFPVPTQAERQGI